MATVYGYIYDAVTKEPLQGVSVTNDFGNGTTTDANGYWQLILNSLSTVLTFSYVGYKTYSNAASVVGNGYKIYMERDPNAELLPEVVVTPGKKKKTGLIIAALLIGVAYIKRKDIAKMLK